MPVIDRRLVDQRSRRRGRRRPSLLRGDRASCGARRYDVAIDLQGLIKSAVLARLSGAPRVIGFIGALRARARWRGCSTPRCTIPAAGACTLRARRATSSTSTSGCSSRSGSTAAAPEFPIDDVDSDVARERCAQQTGGRYALLNPGAAWPNKRWPPARLGGAGARRCATRHGLRSVVLWGPGEETLARGGRRGRATARRCCRRRRRLPIWSRWRAARR